MFLGVVWGSGVGVELNGVQVWFFTCLLHTNYKVVGWCVNSTNVFEYFFKWNFNKQKGSAICTALKGCLRSVVKKTYPIL